MLERLVLSGFLALIVIGFLSLLGWVVVDLFDAVVAPLGALPL